MTELNKNNQTNSPKYFDDLITKLAWENRNRQFPIKLQPYPATNITEMESFFLIEVAAPGIDIDVLEIEVKENGLEIRFEAPNNLNLNHKERIWSKEFNPSSFRRLFQMDAKIIDYSAIEAECEKGVLRIMLPKKLRNESAFLPAFSFSDN